MPLDPARVRDLVDDALEAVRVREAADATLESAKGAQSRAVAREKDAVVALDNYLGGSAVIYGDRLIQMGNDSKGRVPIIKPITQILTVAPPAPPPADAPAPAPVAAQPPPEEPKPKAAAPLSGGKVPDASRKGGGR